MGPRQRVGSAGSAEATAVLVGSGTCAISLRSERDRHVVSPRWRCANPRQIKQRVSKGRSTLFLQAVRLGCSVSPARVNEGCSRSPARVNEGCSRSPRRLRPRTGAMRASCRRRTCRRQCHAPLWPCAHAPQDHRCSRLG